MSKLYKGIDISLYQGNPDFSKVKKAGIDFVMHKAGQGRTAEYNAPFTDPVFEQNIKSCAQTAGGTGGGLYSGSYWYFMANTETQVREEAAYYIELLKKYRFNLQLWAAVDVEDASIKSDYKTLTKHVKLFCDLIKQAGFRPMVYANSWWLNNKFTSPADVPIWEANWGIENMPERARMWQYSSTTPVNGIGNAVDVNIAKDIIGDANDDGKVNLKDVAAIIKNNAGYGNKINESQADINQDGYVNNKDAAQMIKNIVKE